MKQFSSALFPFTIASILAGLTYALQWYVQAPDSPTSAIVEHKPDAIVTHIDMFKIGPGGSLKYRLSSPRLVHFRDDDSTFLENPDLQHFRSEGPPTRIRSLKAHVNGGASVVRFDGAVHLNRPAFRETPPMQADMASLTVYPDDGKAETNSPVTLERGKMWLKGTGMSIDNNRLLYTLHQNTRGFYPPNKHPSTSSSSP